MALGEHGYGKSGVRLVAVTRTPGRHELRDLTVDVELHGAFDDAYVRGDNADLLATDTMRNVVYALARERGVEEPETFGRELVEHFLATGPTVARVRVELAEHPWARLEAGGTPHEHAFQRGHGGTRLATVSGDRERVEVQAGIDDLLVLKTTGSGWAGFLRDRHTTLPETDDRILATIVTARWTYADAVDYGATWAGVRDTLLQAFGDHHSPSVQFTLHRMGSAVLERHPSVGRIHLSLPNRHHLLVDLAPFGLDNPNEVFQATTEPYGLIEGTIERDGEPR
ncbi:MAG: urate oxidase [Solirubrobacteraceae bacterium]|jgi:urate oxidase|nr:urate oxidase [Solirubrobacteraceae bacterium]